MKRTALLLAPCAALFAKAAYAVEEPTPTPVPEWTCAGTNIGIHELYFGRTAGTILHRGPVIQSDTTLVHRSGLYLNYWQSYSSRGGLNSDSGDEIDFTVGRTFATLKGKATLDLGFAYYDLAKLDKTRGDIYAPYVRLSVNHGKVKPYLYLEDDISSNPKAFKGALLFQAGITTNVKGLDVTACVGGHSSGFGYKSRLPSYGQLFIGYPIKVGKHVVLTPQGVTQGRIGGPDDLAQNRALTGRFVITIK